MSTESHTPTRTPLMELVEDSMNDGFKETDLASGRGYWKFGDLTVDDLPAYRVAEAVQNWYAAEVRKAKAEALREVVTYLCGNREIGRWILMHADRIEAGDE